MLTVESSPQKSDHFLVLKRSWPSQSEPIECMFNELPWKGFNWIQITQMIICMCISIYIYTLYIVNFSQTSKCQQLGRYKADPKVSWLQNHQTLRNKGYWWPERSSHKQPSRGSKSLVGPSWHFAKSVPGQARVGNIRRKPVNSQDHLWSLLQNHDDFRTFFNLFAVYPFSWL